MAELTKKLHFKKNTTEYLAKAYSTTAEAGAEYITNEIDGVTAYVPIGATNDSRATIGRVKKSGGTEKAILTMGKPPYAKKQWTTPGTHTFTVPAGVTIVNVEIAGAGGGGADTGSYHDAGKDGQPSIAFGITANGGGGGKPNGSRPNGVDGTNAGNGLGGKGGAPDSGSSGKGGNGDKINKTVSVIALSSYTIIVGAGGAGGVGGAGAYGYPGAAGWVIIEYGGDI